MLYGGLGWPAAMVFEGEEEAKKVKGESLVRVGIYRKPNSVSGSFLFLISAEVMTMAMDSGRGSYGKRRRRWAGEEEEEHDWFGQFAKTPSSN